MDKTEISLPAPTRLALIVQSPAGTALLRAVGAAIDQIVIFAIAILPYIFTLSMGFIVHGARSGHETVSNANVLITSLMVAVTPLPIIYLRIFFRKLMLSPTPGELIAGVTVISKSGLHGFWQEFQYALVQFCVLWMSGLITTLFYCALLFTGKLINASVVPILLFLLTGFLSLAFLTAAYWPRAKDNPQSFIDQQCAIISIRLR